MSAWMTPSRTCHCMGQLTSRSSLFLDTARHLLRCQGKNAALKEAGAIVPESFEGFESAIKEVCVQHPYECLTHRFVERVLYVRGMHAALIVWLARGVCWVQTLSWIIAGVPAAGGRGADPAA